MRIIFPIFAFLFLSAPVLAAQLITDKHEHLTQICAGEQQLTDGCVQLITLPLYAGGNNSANNHNKYAEFQLFSKPEIFAETWRQDISIFAFIPESGADEYPNKYINLIYTLQTVQ